MGDLAPKVTRGALGAGIVGLVIGLLFLWLDGSVDLARFFRAYLTAFIVVLSICLGGLFFTVLHHVVRAGWSVTVRRLAEAIAANLMWIWVLFLPIFGLVLFGRGELLYDWMIDPEQLDPVLAGKSPYLNSTFWLVRAAIFFGIWAALGRFYYSNSVAQDASGSLEYTHRLQRWAPLSMILYAFTQTFAIIDWGMSLEAHWFSTMYPVYFFAASCCGFFAALILLAFFLQRSGRIENEITLEHYQDMGKLLFAFGVVFWAYIAFCQYMLIWYANMPEETTWYLTRRLGGWTGVSWLLLVGHFAVPFLLLVTKHTKRVKPVLAAIAVWLLVMHFVDMYWLVMPEVPASQLAEATTLAELVAEVDAGEVDLGYHPHLVDLTCLLALGALLVAATVRRLGQCSLVPVQDPRLDESLAFENV